MKILVVDDSLVFRSAIVSAISTEPKLEVIRSLVNGKLAIDFLRSNSDIDLITLDMEMPVMDGMETIREIRKFNANIVIIVFSSYTQKGAEKTLEALSAGANDFVTKPENLGSSADESIKSIREELIPKILAFREKLANPFIKNTHEQNAIISPEKASFDLKLNYSPGLILIGSSTGGPEALSTLFKSINKNISVPILIVQHMPPIFTQKLAEMLSKYSPVKVVEAKDGDRLLPGVAYVAPGDYHMTVERDMTLKLNQNEKVCFVRPSVDVLFDSVFLNLNLKTLVIILTGMGDDGAAGAVKLAQKGHDVFVQSKESSVVWGMPGSTKRLLPDAKVLDINDFGRLIMLNS